MASFRKRKNGTWEYRIRFKDPFTNEYKENSRRGFATKKAAQHAASEYEQELLNKAESNKMPLILKHYLVEWLKTFKKNKVRKNTYLLHERNIEKHIIPYFKDIKIKEIKPIMYQKFINYLIEENGKNYSKRTVEIIHGTFYNAMEKAVVLGNLKKNPCNGVIIPNKTDGTKKQLKYIDSDDIGIFLKTAYQYGYIYFIFFKTLIHTGMRKGEAAALQWTDIDFKTNIIKINKTLDFQPRKNESLFGETKTYESTREILIDDSLVQDLRFHMKKQNEDKLVLNDMYHHEINLIFTRNDGTHLPKSSLFNAFSRILKQSNLQPLPIHSLRHTHAVLLLESGASMKYVQKRLGHKNIQITSDVYSHISKKINQTSIDGFGEYIKRLSK